MHISHGVTVLLRDVEDQTSVLVLVLGPVVIGAVVAGVVYWLRKRS